MSTNPFDERNRQVIEEFRANRGVVGGTFEGKPVLLLHHRGARSGRERVSPLLYRRDGDAYVIFASKGGAPRDPDWMHNLRAHPRTTIEVGEQTLDVIARELPAAERAPLWEAQKREFPQFAEYESKTSRTIPVVALMPA